MKKIFQKIAFPLGFFLMSLFVLMIWTDSGDLFLNGFGVDSSGRLYIGRCHKIEVYEHGNLINTIDSRSGRGWEMTVIDDQIIVANSAGIHTWDLNGNELSHEPDPGNMVTELSMMKEIQGADGSKYQLKSRVLGITRIIKDTETIYRIPFADICVRTSWLLAAILLFWFVPRKKTGDGVVSSEWHL